MHGGVGVGLLLVQLLDAEDVGEGLEALHARVLERIGRLFAERGAIHQEEHAAEALGLEQAVDERDAGLGLAGAGGHGEQHVALATGDGGFDGLDGGLLVVAQREAVVEGLVLELLVRAVFVALEERGEALRRVPAVEGMAEVLGTAQVAEPDAALGGELPQEWAPVRREGERNAVGAIRTPVLGVQRGFRRGREATAVALGLLQRRRHIDVLALGFDHRDGRQADEQHVVGRAAVRRPFGNREVFAFLGASALRVDQGRGVRGPAGLPELLIDQLARLGLVEVYRRGCGVRRGDERGDGLPGLRGGLGLLGGEPLLQVRPLPPRPRWPSAPRRSARPAPHAAWPRRRPDAGRFPDVPRGLVPAPG